MGRKKRKVVLVDEGPPLADMPVDGVLTEAPLVEPPPMTSKPAIVASPSSTSMKPTKEEIKEPQPLKSGYAMTSHSAEVVDEDIYVSEGSDEEDEEDTALRNVEMVLAGSRMGVMRRGIHHPMLVQPNRQWAKESANAATANKTLEEEAIGEDEEAAAARRKKEEEEELAKLDPAQRAARLLAEKQRKLEEAKVTARRLESEENAGRDPCLFSKRTAFDIRFDQIDDKPWTRGDITDYLNYGLSEEDWLDYSQQQITIRQELTDASRQRRAPDPTVVPVTPRTPSTQTPKVAVRSKTVDGDGDPADGTGTEAALGPVLEEKKEEEPSEKPGQGPDKPKEVIDVPVAGGAWGAGAAPGSMLAKLIAEQEGGETAIPPLAPPPPPSVEPPPMDSIYGPGGGSDHHGDDRSHTDSYRSGLSRQQHDRNSGGTRGNDYYGHSGGRGYMGGRGGGRGSGGPGGGRGRGGGRGYNDRYQQDSGDYYRNKRPREDYGDSRGGSRWRR